MTRRVLTSVSTASHTDSLFSTSEVVDSSVFAQLYERPTCSAEWRWDHPTPDPALHSDILRCTHLPADLAGYQETLHTRLWECGSRVPLIRGECRECKDLLQPTFHSSLKCHHKWWLYQCQHHQGCIVCGTGSTAVDSLLDNLEILVWGRSQDTLQARWRQLSCTRGIPHTNWTNDTSTGTTYSWSTSGSRYLAKFGADPGLAQHSHLYSWAMGVEEQFRLRLIQWELVLCTDSRQSTQHLSARGFCEYDRPLKTGWIG